MFPGLCLGALDVSTLNDVVPSIDILYTYIGTLRCVLCWLNDVVLYRL